MGKVVNEKELKEIVENLKKQNKKTVFTNGCFDIIHIGHVRYLKASKQCGDILIVGLNSDSSVKKLKGDSRPVNNQNDRAEILSEFNFVDYVIIFDENSPAYLLDRIKPDIYTKGADYTMDNLPEAPVVIKNNIEVHFINFVEGKSTTNILNKIRQN
ncbi:MAG: D-glycero-beta-D-manno-heptose 1-phosphate adenylyltransferase [Candidatus Gastranaerophilales bacterium]|nr:D-glycero-beta-D-manno-heptose 1-phosphate adenylyltransferase [Candidatus Gastranaerophilales bacterium]